MKSKREMARFVYDVEKHLGTQTAKTIGTLPKNAIVTRCQIVTVVPIVGSGASVAIGNSTVTNAFQAAEAITGFDTAGKSQSADVNDIAAATTDALRTVVLIPSAADLTAGSLEIYLDYFVPVLDQTTLVGA